MRFFLFFALVFSFLYSDKLDTNATVAKEIMLSNNDANETQENSEKIIDNSSSDLNKTQEGVEPVNSNESEEEMVFPKEAKTSVAEVVGAVNDKGEVDLSKLQDKWEDLSPTPIKYDWVQTKSGEWFKGEIKALYDDELEFDSDEVGLYTFDFDDVVRIKSYHIISVNIENLASFPGILRLKGNDLTIIQGEHRYNFKRKDIVSFAPDGEYERNFWSGKGTLSWDFRSGNTNQSDYSAQVKIQRRTSISRLTFDYLGRTTSKDDTQTANNHRLTQKYDRYLTREFFWTPISSEYYSDKYKNIDRQLSLGLGVGYALIDTKRTTWSVSGGPALLYTKFLTVSNLDKLTSYAPATELSTHYKIELNSITDITYDYKFTYTTKLAGKYKHHMLLTLENELTSWLDLDITGVWDYILKPEEASDGTTPEQSDFQLLLGLGIEF